MNSLLRRFLPLLLTLSCVFCLWGQSKPPNFVVLFADDLGYGDLGSYGHPTIDTPHLDRMAQEGQRWTSFYVGSSVCTPSRAALLTGRLPIRSGMTSSKQRVLFPDSHGGLPRTEVTIPEMLKKKGYATAHLGKWHLGHLPEYLPTRHGFDYYFGIPYSNDMDRTEAAGKLTREEAFWKAKSEYFHVPLMRNEEIVERPADQTTITRRYTEEAISFMRKNKSKPFFVYLAYNLPHVPLFRSKAFEGRSRRGTYGDVIEEIDWSAGEIRKFLEEEGLAENTLVFFTSDNGPWLTYFDHGGSAGLLRGGKGSTWEGGQRVPAIFWWPGKVKPAVVRDIGSTMDLLPTFAALAGIRPDPTITLDGYDLTPALLHGKESPRDTMFFYRDDELYAVRYGDYKLHFSTRAGYNQPAPEHHDPPLLFHLSVDPGEQWNIADRHPEIVSKLRALADKHKASMTRGKDQLVERGSR